MACLTLCIHGFLTMKIFCGGEDHIKFFKNECGFVEYSGNCLFFSSFTFDNFTKLLVGEFDESKIVNDLFGIIWNILELFLYDNDDDNDDGLIIWCFCEFASLGLILLKLLNIEYPIDLYGIIFIFFILYEFKTMKIGVFSIGIYISYNVYVHKLVKSIWMVEFQWGIEEG